MVCKKIIVPTPIVIHPLGVLFIIIGCAGCVILQYEALKRAAAAKKPAGNEGDDQAEGEEAEG